MVEWLVVKNSQYLQLNLSLNRISDANLAMVQSFIQGVHDGVEISLAGNKISEESMAKLKEEFPTRVK